METIKVLSIDIGIINLGYVYCEMDLKPTKNLNYLNQVNDIRIIDCNKIDITKVKHRKVPFCICKLHHDNCIPDYLDHFIQETNYFQECDILIIERQPPVGITNVQDLLFKQFREKVLLINPCSVHKYFNFPRNAYDLRKEKSEKIAESYLFNFGNFTNNIRKHDISDALLMILYYYKLRTEKIKQIKEEVDLDFERFRFKGTK